MLGWVTNELELRTATADELPALFTMMAGAFLDDAEDDAVEAERLVYEPDRYHVVADHDQLVGSAGVLTRELTVPGAVIPAAHVTGVSVAATHRRRGLLTRMMNAQLTAVAELGTEPIATLWASEGAIYGRFGYGLASWHVDYKIPTQETTVAGQPTGRFRQVVPREALDDLRAVFAQVRAGRPGVSGRPGAWWEALTVDLKSRRRGKTALRGVLYEVDGEVEGYALWRTKGSWGETGPDGEVAVREVVATTTEAYAALWRFLLSIDLTRTVTYMYAATDEALPYLLTNPSGLRAAAGPGLWVRVVDVPGALAARRYLTPIDLVLDVADGVLPGNAGRWHLVGDSSSAKCERTDAAPDLSLEVRELGAAYLGGTSLHSLSAASLVAEHQPGALLAASTAFGWHCAPASIEIF
jgi:predicted acetyltransferase